MVNFDFKTYMDKFIDQKEMQTFLERKEEVYEKFSKSTMNGWKDKVSDSLIDEILETRDLIKQNSSCLVVIGIGGSFLGSYALKEMFSKYFCDESFDVIYMGHSLSSKYMKEVIDYLRFKDFTVNVISKSGTTMETSLAYAAIKKLLKEKYSDDEICKRIIVTTDEYQGTLRDEVNNYGYKSFIIPNNIGGRYSLFTPAHLLPLSFFLDIRKLLDGFYQGLGLKKYAYYYACMRNALFKKEKYIENYCVYEPNLYYYTEWLKQLFGETEGKNGKGIFPVATVHTRDLHSLGQFIQEGNPIIFETFIKVLDSEDFYINNQSLNNINNVVLNSVVEAHYLGGVPCSIITIDKICEESIGKLCAFFMMSAAFSGYLFDVEPFDQPGVEVYKKIVRENLSSK